MADLITLSEYKTLLGVPDDTTDPQITALLPAGSRAVRTFTGRAFDLTTGIATARSYQYDGSGFLDIDDCLEVVGLATDTGIPGQVYDLGIEEWTPMPQDDSDVFYYVLIHGGPYLTGSPEMGFERNLDTIGIRPKSPLVTVTARWGWTAIPEDVKLATALTIQSFVTSSGAAEGLTSEAIEGWSRSWGRAGGPMTALAVPNRARDLLVNYQRIFV